jgi:hypothetical protein
LRHPAAAGRSPIQTQVHVVAGSGDSARFRQQPCSRLTREDPEPVLVNAAENDPAVPHFISAQDFYREAMQRDDIRRIMAALAK